MWLAQSILEYANLSAITERFGAAFDAAVTWIARQDPRVVIGVGGAILVFFFARAFIWRR